MKKENYSYSFTSPKTAHEIFDRLLHIEKWWSGLYEEAIAGKSHKLDDEFTFHAGGGAHYSRQKLVELVPDKSVAWLVTDSKLSFLKEPAEWNGSKIRFGLAADGNHTTVTFTHEGLVPEIECYNNCSSAWNGYMNNLKRALN